MEICPYTQICNNYNRCPNKEYLYCWIYTIFEGILDREVFKTKINKRIFRGEHSHHQEEEIKFPTNNDISLLVKTEL